MKNIIFFVDNHGRSESLDYLVKLKEKNDKASRITLAKANDYFTALAQYGTTCGKPYLDHIDGEIWELRPRRERFLFAKIEGGFLILNHFTKSTQKTPQREIEKANRMYQQYLEAQDEEE